LFVISISYATSPECKASSSCSGTMTTTPTYCYLYYSGSAPNYYCYAEYSDPSDTGGVCIEDASDSECDFPSSDAETKSHGGHKSRK
jgi:hypothetical protein